MLNRDVMAKCKHSFNWKISKYLQIFLHLQSRLLKKMNNQRKNHSVNSHDVERERERKRVSE